VIRAAFRALWVAGVLALLALVAVPHGLDVLDRQTYVVSGASMAPAIPIGSVVVTQPVDAREVEPGDVITFRVGSGKVVTHRVLDVTGGSEIAFATKGDANASADPVTVPAGALLGRVVLAMPVVGLILTVLATTAGTLIALGILATLLLGGWFIDELVDALAPVSTGGAVAEPGI